MEYLGGGSALDLMKPGKINELYVATILREIIKGLDYLHSEGKLHRDIKGEREGGRDRERGEKERESWKEREGEGR